MIYVIHAQSGTEQDIVRSLAINGIQAYAPRQELLERRGGRWNTVQRFLFPGYVFADIRLTDDLYHIIKNTAGVIRILGDPTPLPFFEQQRMQWIFDAGLIGINKGYLKDGRLTITEGFLKGRESEIVSISHRQKRCRLYCEINGKRHYFSVSAEINKI